MAEIQQNVNDLIREATELLEEALADKGPKAVAVAEVTWNWLKWLREYQANPTDTKTAILGQMVREHTENIQNATASIPRGLKSLLNIGISVRGEFDFEASTEVQSLDFQDMQEFRAMIITGIATLEQVWRMREQDAPVDARPKEGV